MVPRPEFVSLDKSTDNLEIKTWIHNWFKQNSLETDLHTSGDDNYFEQGWLDSFKFVSLIADVEETFMISFTDDEFQDKRILSVNGLLEVVCAKVTGKSATNRLITADSDSAIKAKKPDSKASRPLYKNQNRTISYDDFIKAIKEVGVEKGNNVFVYSDISVFGTLHTNEQEYLLNSLLEILRESVGGNGTIIMPTFTYSFCRKELFDTQNSPSTVGTLTEYFRTRSDVHRSKHPIYSVGITGKYTEELLKVGKDCFDKNSIFGKSCSKNTKILFLGAPFQSCTFVHFIEQQVMVPHRYFKTFKGEVKDGENVYQDECTFFVRYLDKNVVYDLSRFEKHLLNKKLMNEKKVGYGRIMMVESETLLKQGIALLNQDSFFFLKGKPALDSHYS